MRTHLPRDRYKWIKWRVCVCVCCLCMFELLQWFMCLCNVQYAQTHGRIYSRKIDSSSHKIQQHHHQQNFEWENSIWFLNRFPWSARRSTRFLFYLYRHSLNAWFLASPQSKIEANRPKYATPKHHDGVSRFFFAFSVSYFFFQSTRAAKRKRI